MALRPTAQIPLRSSSSLSMFPPSGSVGASQPHAASAAHTAIDVASLKRRLAAIVNEVQGANVREAHKPLQELCSFFDAVVEQCGTHLQYIFGQHVLNNIIVLVMDSVVQPALTQFCSAAARRRQMVATSRTARRGGSASLGRRRIATTVAEAAEEELDAYNENRGRKLRTEVVRLWRSLLEILHRNLPSSLSAQQDTSTLLASSSVAMTTGFTSNEKSHTAAGNRSVHGGEMDEATMFTLSSEMTVERGNSAGDSWRLHRQMVVGPNHTTLPLLWKNAVPLFCILRHALEVLQSDVLVALCGQEYAQLLLQLLAFDGYLSNLQPWFITSLIIRLLQLIERTVYEPGSSEATGSVSTPLSAEGAAEKEECPEGSTAAECSSGASPSVEEGTVYAALLVQLLRAPHLMSVFTPCEDTPTRLQHPVTTSAGEVSGGMTVPLAVERLVRLTMQRNLRPTSAMRLEAHLLLALNLFLSVARDDYPLVSAIPEEMIRCICHMFYATTRRDGWRMEALSFMTTQLCVCFSAVLGQSVRTDISRHSPHAWCHSYNSDDDANCGEGGSNTSPSVAPRSLALLHETVFPFTLRLFAVVRSEFSLVSRRELFHFPCPPLAPMFNFGAVVIYLACCTHGAYVALPFTATTTAAAVNAVNASPCAQDEMSTSNISMDHVTSGMDGSNDSSNRGKRQREEKNIDKNVRNTREKQVQHSHPGDVVMQLFRSLFFLNNQPDATVTRTHAREHEADGNDLASLDADVLMQVGAAAGGSLSAAAVQDLVKDGSLFLLHLLAQPGATLGLTKSQCTLLVERGILPLFPYYGVRLETLLLAVLHAVTSRTSVTCQQKVFRWLVRRYMPTVTTQRDDEGHPKEQVYRLLALLLQRGMVGQWPLLLSSEERNRLQTASHFRVINACIRVVVRGDTSLTSSSNTTTGMPTSGAALPSPFVSLFASSAVPSATSGSGGKMRLSPAFFQAMLQFLSSYHHYGAMAMSIIAGHRALEKKKMRDGDRGVAARVDPSLDLPTGAVCLSTGIAFMVGGLSHSVCFFPHDDSVVWRHDLDTTVAATTATSLFLEVLHLAEDYLLGVCLTITESELGWQHSINTRADATVVSTPVSANVGKRNMCAGDDKNNIGSGGGTAVSLQRMRQLLARSRRAIEASLIAPQTHVPAGVCDAAEGHWLLLEHKLFLSSSTWKTRTPNVFICGSGSATRNTISADDSDNLRAEELELHGEYLRRGDVPAAVVEVLAAEVSQAVLNLSGRAKMANAAAVGVTGGSVLQQQQQPMESNEEAVAFTHRTTCIHAVQLLHLLLRLYRLGIWRLPQRCGARNDKVDVADGEKRQANDGKGNTYDNNFKAEGNGVVDDLHIISSLPQPQLLEDPLAVLQRLPSSEGRLYYAVMWICQYLASRLLRGTLVRDRAVLRALLLLVEDVGAVLLSPVFALWEPRQTVLSFVGVVSRRTLDEGIARLSEWRPTNVTSSDAAVAVQTTMRLSCRLLGAILALVRRSGVLTASVDPLVTPTQVTTVIVGILVKEGLVAPTVATTTTAITSGGSSSKRLWSEDTGDGPVVPEVSGPNPFLPFVLTVVDSLAELLQVLHEVCNNSQARLAMRGLLGTLFARYRYGLAESIFSMFSYYALPWHTFNNMPMYNNLENQTRFGEVEDDVHDDGREGLQRQEEQMEVSGDVQPRGGNDRLLVEEGRLLETFVDQLNDASRSDMPPLTPQRLCAILSSIYGLLFRCDATVAEKLGKYLFSFLSPKTAYVVRRHTALQVRFLFNRFTQRASAVLHELFYRAREGIASMSPMLCATSLRALGEAACAAPMMEAEIVCTLLECWATHGFAHKGLIVECLELIGDHTCLESSTAGVAAGGEGGLSAQQLCHYHREGLMFNWLWRLGHPIEAFPIECLGFVKLEEMWESHMNTLLALAILCSARRCSTVSRREGVLMVEEEETAAAVFLQPNELLWRLARSHARLTGSEEDGHEEQKKEQRSLHTVRTTKMLLDCIIAHFPHVMTRLLLFAALSKRRGVIGEWQMQVQRLQGHQEQQRHGDEKLLQDVGDAAGIALEWVSSTLSPNYGALVHRHADAILCNLVELVGTLTPFLGLQEMQKALTTFCEMVLETAEETLSKTVTDPTERVVVHFQHQHHWNPGEKSAVDVFFACDAGDHAYVLLQHLYFCLTHEIHRGSRRMQLALFFQCIVRRCWSKELLQRVPHILHTVLRLCGNMLMTCADVRAVICDVLLYTWTATASSPSSCVRPTPTDEAFVSSIMLSLLEESRVVAATWTAICRTDVALQRRHQEMQHTWQSEVGASNGNDGGGVEKPEVGEGQQQQLRVAELPLSVDDALQRVAGILPLLRNTLLVSGTPASFFYAGVAAAVDRARAAFVVLIHLCTRAEDEEGMGMQQQHQQQHKCSAGVTATITYETCCRVLQHLLGVVCADKVTGSSGETIVASSTSPETSKFVSAAAVLQITNRDAQLSAFRLLRALCCCFIEAGAEDHVDALLSPAAAIPEMLQHYSLDGVLHRAYLQHVEHLYHLAFDADASIAYVASRTLREWLCGDTESDLNVGGNPNKGDEECETSGNATEEPKGREAALSRRRSHRGAGDKGELIQRTLSLLKNVEEKEGHERRQEQQQPMREGADRHRLEAMTSSVRLEEIEVFRRRHAGTLPQANMTHSSDVGLQVSWLHDDIIWDSLRVHEDESLFLRLFLIALIKHYGLQHRFTTVAAILRCLLLPLQQASNKSLSTSGSGALVAFNEGFLPIVLLHVMLLKETETRRAQRVVWSKALESYLFQKAAYFRRTARLFLRALNVCRSLLMTHVRTHGVCPDSGATSYPSRRMLVCTSESAASTSSSFQFFVPSEYGDVPPVRNMRESYWLFDIDPLILAAAAVTCQEPQLAILFTELAGESLLGQRKGIPSSVATPTAGGGSSSGCNSGGVQLQEHHLPQQQYSVLFPSAQRSQYRPRQADGHISRQLRVDDAQAEKMQLLFAYRSAVHAILVDVEAMLRFRESGSGGDDSGPSAITGSATGSALLSSSSPGGDAVSGYTTPWEEAFLLQHPLRHIEREKNRGNWQAVLVLLDRFERSSMKGNSIMGSHRGVSDGLSMSRLMVEKANALMQLGAVNTSLQILASALSFKSQTSRFAVGGAEAQVHQEGHVVKKEAVEDGVEEETDSSMLYTAFAAALWRCGKWDVNFLQEWDQQGLRRQKELLPHSILSVDEGIFRALLSLRHGKHQDAWRWCLQAQQLLLRRLDASNWLHTTLQAEALHNIEECVERSTRVYFPPLPPPSWVCASLKHVQLPYHDLELLDSVQQQLCAIYRHPQWWITHLEVRSERALYGNRPLLVQQWLSAYMDEFMKDTESHNALHDVTTSCGLPANVFLSLLRARTEFVSGYPRRAIAIVQNITTSVTPSSCDNIDSLLFPLPKNAPLMPVIVRQLVEWARETRMVPLSQLVRDPFLTTCATSDRSGACSLELARLCHALARDISIRLHSAEYRTLQESTEASRRTRVELKGHGAVSNLNEAEKKLLCHRIRTIEAETERVEKEWAQETEVYALYRRSALHAYARFLQYSGPAGAHDLLAVFGFVSLWLQQDERIDDRFAQPEKASSSRLALATNEVLRKAIMNTPLQKFLPLFSQLVAQLGTSLDDVNLEDLVRRIGEENTLHAVWPLLALANGHNFGPAATEAANCGSGGLHAVDEKKVALARRILTAMKDSSDVGTEWRQRVLHDAEKLSAAYMQLAFYRLHDRGRSLHTIPSDFMILDKSTRDLFIPPPTLTLSALNMSSSLPLQQQLSLLPRIAWYEAKFTTPGGINLPKALRCVLTDGRIVRQLLKSEDDLRQDSLIEQVFDLSNKLLAKERATRRLHVSTYNVVPLAPTVGIIEWVDGTIPLDCYLNGSKSNETGGSGRSSSRWSQGAHARYFPEEPTTLECRERMQAARSRKHEVLLELYTEFTPALHYFFFEHFFTPQEWLERRDAYTRSVAVSSIVGYIVGLGDRHLNNLLLQTRRAEIVHIDLGYAFEQGKLLPVPELVPFRLTRNIVDGFGVQGTDGPFRRYCEGTLGVLRTQKELLMTILGAFAHDPLARWVVTVVPQQQQQQQLAKREEATPRQRDLGVRRGRPTYADAERTLSRVAEKIQGYESGELLSVATHVHKLVQVAQNTELLAYMFEGWSPWV